MHWLRDEVTIPTDRTGRWLSGVSPAVRLRTRQATGRLRVGIWAGDQRVAGWTMPWLPANATVIIDPPKIDGWADGTTKSLVTFVRDWDGRWPRPLMLPHGEYRLTLDQDPGVAVDVLVDVLMTPVGVA